MPARSTFCSSLASIIAALAILAAPAALAQVPAEVRSYPASASRLLAASPDRERAVYVSDGDLLFEDAGGLSPVQIDGKLAALHASASGRFAAALVRQGAAVDMQIYAADGTLKKRFEQPLHPDERLPRMAVSDADGRLAYALPSTGEICFLTTEAGPRCSRLFKDAPHDVEREVLLDFDADGRFVAVAAQREAARPDLQDDNIGIFLFDADGVLLWTRDLPGPGLRSLAVSPEGQIAVSVYDAFESASGDIQHVSRILSDAGTIVAEAPYAGDTFVFRGSSVLLQSNRSIALLQLDTGESRLLFRPPAGMQIISADRFVAPDAAAATVLTGRSSFGDQGFVFDSLRLLEIDDEGTIIADTPLDLPSQHSPQIRLSVRSTSLVLDDAIHTYSR